MRDWYIEGRYSLTGNGKYSITLGYGSLIGIERRWEFAEILWNKYATPKHNFINWLVVQKRLLTKDRLQAMGMGIEDTECILCKDGTPENANHLFTQCSWITNIWREIQNWLGVKMQNNGAKELLLKIKKKRWVRERKEVIVAAYEAVIYHTWMARNAMIFKKLRQEEELVIWQMKNIIRIRVHAAIDTKQRLKCTQLIQRICS